MSNPYDVTTKVRPVVLPASNARRKTTVIGAILWPFFLAANLIAPLIFAESLLRDPGLAFGGVLGIGAAVAAFLTAGWGLYFVSPVVFRRLVAGTGVLILTQFLPILQMMAGMFALNRATAWGLVDNSDQFGREFIPTEFGIFVVTIITGAILSIAALLIGFVIAKIYSYSSHAENRRRLS